MSTDKRNSLREIMNLAWQFVRRNGYSLSEALKTAWLNAKLKSLLKRGVAEFYYKKVDGSLRQAFGTLKEGLVGETKGTGRRPNDNLQVYFDTEKGEYRSFKKCNLILINKSTKSVI